MDVMGTPAMPTYMLDPNFFINKATLLERLNQVDAFDKPMVFKTKDKLEVVLHNTADIYRDRLTFTFEFKRGKWHAVETDPFELMSHYDEELNGKIKSALKKGLKDKPASV